MYTHTQSIYEGSDLLDDSAENPRLHWQADA